MAKAQEPGDTVAEQLRRLSTTLLEDTKVVSDPSGAAKLLAALSEVDSQLREVISRLDPVKQPEQVFDPSNPAVVGRIVGLTLVSQPRRPLSELGRFYGSGVYALYYLGDYPAYQLLSGREHPIYVGKADPADPASKTAIQQGERLSRRLGDHKKNILKAETTLDLRHFEYRALVVQTGWQTAAENYLIDLFKPIWNSEINICYGFGKHGDSPETRKNLRSPWDTLHPGRAWAYSDPDMKSAKTAETIHEEIRAHLQTTPPFSTKAEILSKFLDEISNEKG